MNSENAIKEKIQSYFNGSLPATEEAELAEWIKKDPKNREFFCKLKDELDPEKISHELLPGSYKSVREKLFGSDRSRKNKILKTRRLYVSVSRVAALFFLVAALSFSLAWLMTSRQQQEVAWFETNAPRGEKSKLILPDGSRVWLNSESTISFPNNFMDGNRQVKLTGEAYFEVEKRDGAQFVVKTDAYDIQVLGTKFNVMAYDDFNRVETSLIEGHVQIQKGGQKIELEPGQMVAFKNNRLVISETNTIQSGYWKDGRFDFDRVTFSELIARLERWYDVDIKMENDELNDIVYSGVFKNEETIWQVLNSIQLTLPIKYSRIGFREFVIERK